MSIKFLAFFVICSIHLDVFLWRDDDILFEICSITNYSLYHKSIDATECYNSIQVSLGCNVAFGNSRQN